MWEPVKFFSFVGYYPCFLQLLQQHGQWRSVGSSLLGAHPVLVGLILGRTITVFTQMQDDSNQRRPHKQNMCAKGKCIHPNLIWPSKKQNICQEKIFYQQFHKLNAQSMSDSVYLYQLVSLSPSSQSVPSSSSHSLLTPPSSSLPFHNISSI